MPVRLAGAGRRTAVEKPQAARVGLHGLERLPIGRFQPARLGFPLLRDQQHVAVLHRIFVQQQQVALAESLHLQVRLPGQKRVGSWPRAAPGTVLEAVKGLGLVLATGGCPLLLRQAQLEGKAAVEGEALRQQLS